MFQTLMSPMQLNLILFYKVFGQENFQTEKLFSNLPLPCHWFLLLSFIKSYQRYNGQNNAVNKEKEKGKHTHTGTHRKTQNTGRNIALRY